MGRPPHGIGVSSPLGRESSTRCRTSKTPMAWEEWALSERDAEHRATTAGLGCGRAPPSWPARSAPGSARWTAGPGRALGRGARAARSGQGTRGSLHRMSVDTSTSRAGFDRDLIEALLTIPVVHPGAARHATVAPFDGQPLAEIPFSTVRGRGHGLRHRAGGPGPVGGHAGRGPQAGRAAVPRPAAVAPRRGPGPHPVGDRQDPDGRPQGAARGLHRGSALRPGCPPAAGPRAQGAGSSRCSRRCRWSTIRSAWWATSHRGTTRCSSRRPMRSPR